MGFLLLPCWPVLHVFVLLCCIEGTINELEGVDCTVRLNFHSSTDLFSVTELIFLDRREPNCFFKL